MVGYEFAMLRMNTMKFLAPLRPGALFRVP